MTRTGSILLALLVFWIGCAGAQIDLRLATAIPQPAIQHKLIFDPWIEQVQRDSKGTVRITNTHNTLANVGTIYDSVVGGVIDIAWVLHGFTPGKFPKSSVVQLPFETTTAEESTAALWRLYERGVVADEYKDIKVLGLHGFPQAVLHSKNAVKDLADMKGLKVRISSKVLADVASSLGATPVSLSSVQAYQHLSRGLVDADMVQWTIVCVARINEATRHHFEAGFGGQGGMIVMNRATWDKLPAAAKEAFEKNSGREFSLANGRLQDRIHTECRDQTTKMSGHQVTAPAAPDAWRKAIQPAVTAWLESTAGGQETLQAYRQEVAAFRKQR